jgi:hypothetical protein
MNNKKDANEFRNNIDLMYLTNSNNLTNCKKEDNLNVNIEVEKHKTFILSCTKKLLKNEIISPEINYIFNEYAANIIKHYQFKNRTRIIQEQYKDIITKKKSEKYVPINIEKMDINVIGKKKKVKNINLNAFVKKKKNKKKKKMILPKKQNFD